jgi:hypothetical protein
MAAMAGGSIAWQADTIKALLAKPGYTPNQTTHQFRSSVTAQEFAAGGGYTAGGTAIGTPTKAFATLTTTLDGNDIAWTNLSGTVRYVVVYKSRGGADTADELIGYVDLGGDQVLVGADLSIIWNAAGIFTLTVS